MWAPRVDLVAAPPATAGDGQLGNEGQMAQIITIPITSRSYLFYV